MNALTWRDFSAQQPELAAVTLERIRAHEHHVLATIDEKGAPRVGGTCVMIDDGELWIGMMPQAARIRDLERDPRCTLHTAPLDTNLDEPDVRITMIARRAGEEQTAKLLGENHPANGVVWTLRLTACSLVRVRDGRLHVEHWRTGQPLRRLHLS